MEDMGSLWDYQQRESVEELKQKLMSTTFELESAKNLNMELLSLLKIAYQERDEARVQLQKLLNNLVPTQLPNNDKASTMALSSPHFSCINVVVDSNNVSYFNQPLVQDYNCCVSLETSQKPNSNSDPATIIIDALVNGKALPQKGNLLEAVIKAGPLLQTFLVKGSLPRWRYPPPLKLQPIKDPPFTIKDIETCSFDLDQNFAANMGNSFEKLPALDSSTPQTCSGPWNNACHFTSNASVNNQVSTSKRQKLQ